MYAHALTLFQSHLKPYCQALYADLPADSAHRQPQPGMNTPSWLLGHLAVAADYAAKLAGGALVCPPLYQELFAPGTQPLDRTADHPPLGELMRLYVAAHDAAAAQVPHFTAEQAAAPNAFAKLLPHLPTNGDVLLHLLTTHEGIHLGQLSAWRRAAGLKGLA